MTSNLFGQYRAKACISRFFLTFVRSLSLNDLRRDGGATREMHSSVIFLRYENVDF